MEENNSNNQELINDWSSLEATLNDMMQHFDDLISGYGTEDKYIASVKDFNDLIYKLDIDEDDTQIQKSVQGIDELKNRSENDELSDSDFELLETSKEEVFQEIENFYGIAQQKLTELGEYVE